MNKILILILLIFATNLLNSAELVQVNGKESEEFQESAFIKLMGKFNNGKIPYPFSKLLDSFGTGIRENGQVLLVPKGRSLVKEHADFKNPRIIVAATSTAHLDSKSEHQKNSADKKKDINRKIIQDLGFGESDLFIGLAPNHNALEVISYNPNKPGYDFFIIENYEKGKTPKIVSDPAQCLSCHQNEAPIFSKFPWHELIGNTANFKDAAEIFTTNNNEMMERVKKANPGRKEIEGINLSTSTNFNGSRMAFFDELVRSGTRTVKNNKICQTLCSDKNSIECQKEFIKISFSEKPDFAASKYFKNAVKNLNDIKMKSSVIPDRDPYTNVVFKDFTTNKALSEETVEKTGNDGKKIKMILGGEKEKYDVTYIENPLGFLAADKDDLTTANPATPRTLYHTIAELQYDVNLAKNVNDKISLIAKECFDSERIKSSANQKLNPKFLDQKNVADALKKWPNTEKLQQLILSQTQPEIVMNVLGDNTHCDNTKASVMPVFKYSSINKVIEKLNDEKIKKPEALFGKYCMQCHGGENAFIKLPLDSATKMANYKPRFGTTGIQERLEHKIMPPAFAEAQPTEQERTQMLNLLKEIKN